MGIAKGCIELGMIGIQHEMHHEQYFDAQIVIAQWLRHYCDPPLSSPKKLMSEGNAKFEGRPGRRK